MGKTKSKEQLEVVKNFKMKKVVAGRGHDCGGLICDVYLNGKMVIDYHDDGWGGEPECRFTSKEAEATVTKFLTENNYAQLMFDNGWQFMESADKIHVNTQIDDVLYQLQLIGDEEKAEKAIKRACKNKIVFGTVVRYSVFSWKGVKKLEDLLKYGNGLKLLQDAYDQAKAEKGEVFNDAKHLEELGVKL